MYSNLIIHVHVQFAYIINRGPRYFEKYLFRNLHWLKYNVLQFTIALKARYDLDCVESAIKP